MPNSAGTAALICVVAIVAVTNFESLSNRSTQQNNIRKLRRDQNGRKREKFRIRRNVRVPCAARGVHYFYLLFARKRIKSILSSLVSFRFTFLSTVWRDEMRAPVVRTYMTLNFPYFSQQIGNSIEWGRLYDVECDSSLIIFEFEEFKVNCWIMCTIP